MKLNKILMGLLTLAGTVSISQGDTLVRITGATAFRNAAMTAIANSFTSLSAVGYAPKDSSGGSVTSLNGSTWAVFKGVFPNVSGTTTIVTAFSGSVEGIMTLDGSVNGGINPSWDIYLDPALVTSGTVASPQNDAGLVASVLARGDMAFSDVTKASTPYGANVNIVGGPVGVVVFTMIKTLGDPGALGFTNITSKQFRALLTAGNQPLSLFTGVAADASHQVFATGRNDGSGTRTTYLAESGFGITNLVKQYIGGTSGGATWIQLAGTTGKDISTVWGQNTDGNGGFNSGSNLKNLFKSSPTSSVAIYLQSKDTSGFDASTEGPTFAHADLPGVPITLVTFLSNGDAAGAIGTNAAAIAFNGVSITPDTAGLSAPDKAKIAYGQYTAWGNEQFYHRSLDADQLKVFDAITAGIPANIGSAGMAYSEMHVSRTDDGGVVAP